MHVGVSLPVRELADDLGAIKEFAQAAEELGFTQLRIPDLILRKAGGHLHEPACIHRRHYREHRTATIRHRLAGARACRKATRHGCDPRRGHPGAFKKYAGSPAQTAAQYHHVMVMNRLGNMPDGSVC